MPYIKITTSRTITKQNESTLTEKLGQDIAIIPGKSERWLMLCYEDNMRMALGGDDLAGTAMVEVSAYGKTSRDIYDVLTEALTATVSEVLDIPQERVYIKYSEHSVWGWNGINL